MNETYKSKADPDVMAFTLFYVDCYPIGYIANELQMPTQQAEAAIKRQLEIRRTDGTLPTKARKQSIGHEIVAEEQRVCDQHGPYLAQHWGLKQRPENPAQPWPQWLKPFWGNCPDCDRRMQDEVNREDARIKLGKNSRDLARTASLLRAGIEERYHGVHLMNWAHPMDQQDRVWRWAMEFCSSFETVLETGRNVALTGANGTGKTRLAISMLTHVIDKGGTGFYTTAINLFSRIKDTYNAKATETERQAIDFMASLDLLVIDEVGKQVDSQYDQSQLFRIFDLRYQRLKPTILVANFSRTGLEKFLGQATVDRLKEAGGGILVFDWASQRSHKKPKEGDEA